MIFSSLANGHNFISISEVVPGSAPARPAPRKAEVRKEIMVIRAMFTILHVKSGNLPYPRVIFIAKKQFAAIAKKAL